MFYEIFRITDRRGIDKLDDKAEGRLGLVIDMGNSFIMNNRSAFLVCVDWEKSIITSPVEDWIEHPGEITIKTMNSIYTLRRSE